MEIFILRNRDEYERALVEADEYFAEQPDVDSLEGRRFELLLLVIRDYEDRVVPIEAPDPVDILRFAISDMGRTQAELGDLLGGRSRASEILNRKRALNLDQIRRISRAWRLPIETLTRAYALANKTAAA